MEKERLKKIADFLLEESAKLTTVANLILSEIQKESGTDIETN